MRLHERIKFNIAKKKLFFIHFYFNTCIMNSSPEPLLILSFLSLSSQNIFSLSLSSVGGARVPCLTFLLGAR